MRPRAHDASDYRHDWSGNERLRSASRSDALLKDAIACFPAWPSFAILPVAEPADCTTSPEIVGRVFGQKKGLLCAVLNTLPFSFRNRVDHASLPCNPSLDDFSHSAGPENLAMRVVTSPYGRTVLLLPARERKAIQRPTEMIRFRRIVDS